MPTRRPQAFWLFFPAAALLAAAAVPLSVWAVLGGGGRLLCGLEFGC